MVGVEDGGWDTLICDAATATFSLLSVATRLALDTISPRGRRGSEGPICMPGLAVVVLSMGAGEGLLVGMAGLVLGIVLA